MNSYLIADYERSTFSVNQCLFSENAQQDIRPILVINGTNATGPSASQPPQPPLPTSPVSGLPNSSRAVIIGCSILGVVLLCIAAVFARRWRNGWRKACLETEAREELPGNQSYPAEIESKGLEHELEATECAMPELHAEVLSTCGQEGEIVSVELAADPYELSWLSSPETCS